MLSWSVSEEEQLIMQSASAFFRETMPIDRLRKMQQDKPGADFSRDEWKSMAGLGWTGILIPEEFGGFDFGFQGLGSILEIGGRHLAATPLLGTAASAARLILKLGSPEQKKRFLKSIATGEHIISLAHEEGARHASPSLKAKITRHGEGFLLNGSKSLCLDMDAADHILALVNASDDSRDRHSLAWVLLPKDREGITIERYHLVDGSPAAQVIFKDVTIDSGDCLGPIGEGEKAYQELCQEAAACLSAAMLGTAAAAFDKTLFYLKERKQFGVAIGSFQALQHRMAILYSEIEVSRAVVRRCLIALDQKDRESGLYASLAKAKLSDLLPRLTAEAIQLHGGIGMTDEHDIGYFLKRSRIETELFGNAEYHRDLYASYRQF